jgi:cation-transporting ATPase E
MQGLSASDVIARRAQGLGNAVRLTSSRSYWQILRQNAFTFINTVLFAIGLVLILMGRAGDAVVTAGLVLLNVVVGVAQEGRAKRTLDRIALLTRPKASVIREGREQTIDPSELVAGDMIVARPGDQIVVDGQVVGQGRMDVDESLLTGESDLIPKQAGDAVYSGSLCVTGSAFYEARQVGAGSLAQKMTASARAFRQIKTPLQRDIDLVIRVMVLLTAQLGTLLILGQVFQSGSAVETVQIAAVIVALVPQGLFFMTTLTYAGGAVRMAGKGALIQQANAIESMSHVDVLCMDKTGTLTTNRIQLQALHPIGIDEADLKRRLGDMVASASVGNRTADAIRAACPGQARRVVEESPFSSARKWSALAFDDAAAPGATRGGALYGAYVLGAPEMLQLSSSEWQAQADQWTAQGLRVVMLAHAPEGRPLHDERGEPQLPSGLIPLGLLSFSDELRSEARATLQGLAEAGVQLKIISGDNPQTVAALAVQAGLSRDLQFVSGLELDKLDDAQLAQAAETATVFGRITPQQKERLVRALRSRGHYVAMMGDGVNDVLSLKQAQLGIALQSGSQAARAVADMVLLQDAFSALPAAFLEGQRIVRGMQDVLRLFLARTLYLTLLILGAAVVGVAFPMTPKHNSVLALLTVGLPTLALAMWAKPGNLPRSILRSVLHFVLSAAFTVGVAGLAVYLGYLWATGDVELARTALTTTTVLCGLALIVFVEPPTPAWVGGDELSGDRRPVWLALGLLAAFAAILFMPPLREFFELRLLPPQDFAFIGLVLAAWALAVRYAWRQRVVARMLNLDAG